MLEGFSKIFKIFKIYIYPRLYISWRTTVSFFSRAMFLKDILCLANDDLHVGTVGTSGNWGSGGGSRPLEIINDIIIDLIIDKLSLISLNYH